MQTENAPRLQMNQGQTLDSASPSSSLTTDSSLCYSTHSHERAARATLARNTSGRRRFVDPTTCERDYKQAELDFMRAMQEYKQRSGRMFPTWSEVLEVLKSLGYEKMFNVD